MRSGSSVAIPTSSSYNSDYPACMIPEYDDGIRRMGLIFGAAIFCMVLSEGCGGFPGMQTGVPVYGSSHGWYGPTYADPW